METGPGDLVDRPPEASGMHPTRPRGDHRDPDEEWQRVLDHIARRRSELSHALQDARPCRHLKCSMRF